MFSDSEDSKSLDRELENTLHNLDFPEPETREATLTLPIGTVQDLPPETTGPGRRRVYRGFPADFRRDACIKFWLRRFRRHMNPRFPQLATDQPALSKHFFNTRKLPSPPFRSVNKDFLNFLFSHEFFSVHFNQFFDRNGEAMVEQYVRKAHHREFYMSIGRQSLREYHQPRESGQEQLADEGELLDRRYLFGEESNYTTGFFSGHSLQNFRQPANEGEPTDPGSPDAFSFLN